MKNYKALQKVRLTSYLVCVSLLLWLSLRVTLWIGLDKTQINVIDQLKAFGLGLWFDVWALAYLVLPFLLVSALLSNKFRQSKFILVMRWVVAWVVVAALIFGVAAEYLFWDEFTARFNFIAVDYLIYTKEVIGNIQESYPLPWIFSGIALSASLITFVASRYVRFDDDNRSARKRFQLAVVALLLPVLSYSLAHLDQNQATSNSYTQELSNNGLFSLAAAMRRNDLDYNRFYKTLPDAEAKDILVSLGVHQKSTPAEAAAKLGPFIKAPKNVVLITVESLSAEYVGSYGNNENLTPKLDKLASEGLKFERLFATGTRTVRGLEALSLGTPPVPGQAIVRRPNNEHLSTVGQVLKSQGVETQFVYGGYGYFDNMNAFFKGNDYEIFDRTDFDPKTIVMENVWGVADESLFANASNKIDALTAAKKPFFMHVMTTSNHRPFTYPDNRIDMPSGHRQGAVKYTDYAIGEFIENAKTKPWFNDTLFVVVADHCASVAGKTELPVDKYHIPMIFYAPALIKPGKFERLVSQIDIAPTLLDVMGYKGRELFYGQNMFAAKQTKPRAFISNYQSLGYYKDNQLIVLSPKQAVQSYQIDPVTYEATPSKVDAKLLNEAIAYYQTASNGFKAGELKFSPDSLK